MPKGSMERDVRINAWEIASWVVCVVVFSLWHWITTRALSLEAPVFFSAISFLFWLSGRLIAESCEEVLGGIADFNLFFLAGFFFVNTTVYLLFLTLPFTVVTDLALVSTAVVVLAAIRYKKCRVCILKFQESPGGFPSFLALLLILVATSLWTQSSLNPTLSQGYMTIYKPWLDSFFHAQKIAGMASSQGFWTLKGMLFSGQTAPFYHYAGYILPAELAVLTPTTAYQSFCCNLVPWGFLLSGLAAFVLIRSWGGAWAGFSACVLLFLVPDPAQMVTGNHFFSYQWMQQISPTGLYGVALMALAWLFMFEACKRGSFLWIAISCALFLTVVNYKAHIFLANVLPMGVYPALFFGKYSKSARWVFVFFVFCVLLCLMKISEWIPVVPLVRLDGSLFYYHAAAVVSKFENPFWKDLFSAQIVTPFAWLDPWLAGMRIVEMIFFCTFGAMGFLSFVMLWFCRKKINPGILFFGVLVILNYLLMSLGLAYDVHRIAGGNELLHRPFVWAYFVVTSWVGGMIWVQFRDVLGRHGKMRQVILGISFLALFFPFYFGRNVMRGPSDMKILTNHYVSKGLVKACDFIRTQSGKKDIVQDSQNDKKAIVTALSERPSYVIDYYFRALSAMRTTIWGRSAEIEVLKELTDPQEITDFFVQRHIRWFILHPGDATAWGKDLLERCVYESQGYRVYFFKDA